MTTTAISGKSEVIGRVQRSYPRLRRILVPLDFSGRSRAVLRLAAPLAAKFGARLVLLHVLTKKTDLACDRPSPAANPRRTAAHRRLRETALQFAAEDLIERTIVRAGEPVAEILAACRSLGADLLAITTEGESSRGGWLETSTAQALLRHAPCPVLTVRKR